MVEAPSNDRRSMVREVEEKMEEKVYQIWSVLSSFEESSAACISDMLLHVSNGAYIDGVFVAERFIWHVEILFASTDALDSRLANVAPKGKRHLHVELEFSKSNLGRTILFPGGKAAL